MSKVITPVLLIIIAVVLTVTFTQGRYGNVQALLEEEEQYDEALDRARELQQVRDNLLNQYNNFDSEDIERIKKMLPDHVDNVRLIIEIDNVASQYDMTIEDVAFTQEQRTSSNEINVEESSLPYQSIVLSFSVTSDYEDLLLFLGDLERSLRLVELERLTFQPGPGGVNDYNVAIRTFWLKESDI